MTRERWFEIEVRVRRTALVLQPDWGYLLPPTALAEAIDEQAEAIAALIVGPHGGAYRVVRIEPHPEWSADQTGLSLGEVLFGSALVDGGTAEHVIVPVRILARYVRPAKR